MTQLTYLRYEVIRTYRNRRFLLFSLAFPLILFLAVAGPHKNSRSSASRSRSTT